MNPTDNMYYGWDDPYATYPTDAQKPQIPSSTARAPFRSSPPAIPVANTNDVSQKQNTSSSSSLFLTDLLMHAAATPLSDIMKQQQKEYNSQAITQQQQQQRGCSSVSSTNVWQSRSQSRAKQQAARRQSITSSSSTSTTTQNKWASRSRTPESQTSRQQGREIIKQVGHKKTKQTKRLTKQEKIASIHNKGEVGKLSNGVWYKASKGSKAPVRKPTSYRQRSAAKQQRSSVRRQGRRKRTRTSWVQPPQQQQAMVASEETVKALRKLRKKVRECAKIQKNVDNGVKVEDNQLAKLKQLNEFKQQIAKLEQEVSTGKAVDNQGFQVVSKRR